MRSLAVLVLLAVLVGCASAPPEPEPRSPAAGSAPVESSGSPAASRSSSESVASTAIRYADHPDVLRAFKPGTQAALRDWSVELVLFEQDRQVLPDERGVRVQGRMLPVVQAVQLDDPEVRRLLLGQLYEAVATHGQRSVAGCFEPHHLLIATDGRHRVEVVVCLMCQKLVVYRDGGTVGSTNFTAAARPAFEALIGPTRGRAFEGRTLHQWRARLDDAGDALARGEVATVETAAVALMARAVGWGELWASLGLSTLERLGPAAALAVPELARLLDAERSVDLRRALLRTLPELGPASIAALPSVERLVRDERLGARARVVRNRLLEVSGVAPVSTGVPFADAARVLTVIPTDLQEVLLESELEVAVVESRAVAAGERSIEGHPVIRTVSLPSREARAALLAELYEGLEDAWPSRWNDHAPRYALAAQRDGRRVVLLLDAYVGQLQVVVDGVFAARTQLWSTARRKLERLLPDHEDR